MILKIRVTLFIIIISVLSVVLYVFGAEKKKSTSGTVNSCITCHQGLQNARLKNPVIKWRKGVHARAGKKCELCHGGDPSIMDKDRSKKRMNFIGKPTKKQITDFCGRDGCHAKALEQFKRGPHYQSVLKTNEPNCTNCHGEHNIQRSSMKILDDPSCSRCHSVKYSREIKKSIKQIDTGIKTIENQVNFLKGKYAETKKLEARVNRVKHLFHQLVHVFSKQEIKSTRRIIQLEIRSLTTQLQTKIAITRRLDLLFLFMIIFGFVTVFGFSFYTLYMYTRRRQ